jgi:hypothetical protein
MKIKFIREVFAGDFPKDITVMRSRYYEQPLNEYMHRLATHFNFERTPEMRTALLSHLGKSLLNMAQNKTDPGKIKLKNVKAREKRNQKKEELRQSTRHRSRSLSLTRPSKRQRGDDAGSPEPLKRTDAAPALLTECKTK